MKASENKRLKQRTIYSDGTTSLSDEHLYQQSPALLPIPVINTCKNLRILHKIPSFHVPAKIEQQAGLENVKPDNKKIVTVRSIYKKNQNGKSVCKFGKNLVDSEVFNPPLNSTFKPVPSSDDESSQPKLSSLRHPPPPVPRPPTPVPSSDSSHERPSCCPLRSVTFNNTCSDDFHDWLKSSSTSSLNDTIISLEKNQRFVSDVVKAQETENEARGNNSRVFNPSLNSTFKPVPSSDDESSQPEFSSSRQPPPPVPRPPTPVPSSDSSHERPSCCPLQSVTFNNTSSDDFQDCFQSSSTSSLNDTMVSPKKNQRFVSNVVKTHSHKTENEARGDSTCERKKAKMKSSRNKSYPPSFKWNGRCVFDSGYPSLMVGDRIESASEDEELWEKRSADVQIPSVKRHVFGRDIQHKQDLIPAQKLYQNFNSDEVDVYLKERREQCNRWLFGVDPKAFNKYPTNVRKTANTSSTANVPLGFESPSQFTNLPVSDSLTNLHNEPREIRNESEHLRTDFPQIINDIERRQQLLEARMDVLASRGTFMAFPDAGEKNTKRKLKTLHNKDIQKCEQSNHDTILKRDESIFVEDIENETSTFSTNINKYKQHESKVCDPKKFKLIGKPDDHSVIPKPIKVQTQLQQKAQLNNSNDTITTNESINIKSEYNQTDIDVQLGTSFADDTKKVICMGLDNFIVAKNTCTKLCDENTTNQSVFSVHCDPNNSNDYPVNGDETSEYQKSSSPKDQFNKMLGNNIPKEAPLKQQIVISEDRIFNNNILDVHSVPLEPRLSATFCPTVMANTTDQQSVTAKNQGEISNTVVTKRLSSSKLIDKDTEHMMTIICQNKSESETNTLGRKIIGDKEEQSYTLVGGVLELNDRHINSSNILNTNGLSEPKNIAADFDTDIMLPDTKIIKQIKDVVGTIKVGISNLHNTSLRESILHTLQPDNDDTAVDNYLLDKKNIGNEKSSIGTCKHLAGSNNESITNSIQSKPTTDSIPKTTNLDASILVGANNAGMNNSSKTIDDLTGESIKKASDKEQTQSLVNVTTQQVPGLLSSYEMDTGSLNQKSGVEDILGLQGKTLVNMDEVKSKQENKSQHLHSSNGLKISSQFVKDNEKSPGGIKKCLSMNDASNFSGDEKNKVSKDLKSISLESERGIRSFISEDLVFRKYLRKIDEQPQTSRSPEVGYLSDEMVSEHEENIINTEIDMNVASEIDSEIQSGLLDDERFSDLPKKPQYSTTICSSHNQLLSNIESGMLDDQVVSKLNRHSQSSNAIHSSQLVSDIDKEAAYVNVQTGLDVVSGIESEIISELREDEVLSDDEKQNLIHSVNDIIFGNDEESEKVNFDKSGVKFEANQLERAGHGFEGVIENEAVRPIVSCPDSIKEETDIEHKISTKNAIVQDELQQGLGKNFKTNLRPIVFESEKGRVDFSKNNLVFRNDVRKMRLLKDFQSSETGSLCNQVALGTNGMIITENNTKMGSDDVSESELDTYNTKDRNSIVGIKNIYKNKDLDQENEKENSDKCYHKTNRDESIKEMLPDDLERNVVDRGTKLRSVVETESKETVTDVLDHFRKVQNRIINKEDENVVHNKKDEVLKKQTESKKDDDYYELGDFDKMVEELLDDGFKNLNERGTVEKCVPDLLLPEIKKEDRFAVQDFNAVLVDDKMLTKVKYDIDEDYKTKYIIKQNVEKDIQSKGIIDDEDVLNASLFDEDFLTQVEQHKPDLAKPEINEKLNVGRDKVFRQIQKINVGKDFNDIEDNVNEGQNMSTGISYQNSHLGYMNVCDLVMNDNSKITEKKYKVQDIVQARNARQSFAEKELCHVENDVYENRTKAYEENQSGCKPCGIGKQRNKSQEAESRIHSQEFLQNESECMSLKMGLPYSSTVFTNLQINSLPSFTKSLGKESTFQDDSTTTSLEQSASDRKSPNLVVPDTDTTCSEYMSSPEPSLQEGAFNGEMNFKNTVERDILAQLNNSSSSDGRENTPLNNYSSYFGRIFPFHENIDYISSASRRKISPEDKSGYISEAEFDTSFSDNLSYVEGSLGEEDKAIVEETEYVEKEKLFEHETETKLCLTSKALNLLANQSLQKQEKQVSNNVPPDTVVAEIIRDNNSKHVNHSQNSFDVENNLHNNPLTHPDVPKTKPREDLNIMINGSKETNQTQSLINAKSSVQETEMPEIQSKQKSFKEIIFGNVDVVAITPGKEKSQSLREVKDSGHYFGHIGLFEQSLKAKQNPDQKMNGKTSESTCHKFYLSQSEVTPEYNKLSERNINITQSTNKPTSEYDDGIALSNNKINHGYNYVAPSYDHTTSSYNEDPPEKDKVSANNSSTDSTWLTARNNNNSSAKENISADKIKNGGCQNISLDDDVELCRANISNKREHEFERQHLTEGNDFQYQKMSSGDDLKLHLHSSEEELNRNYFLESSASENERQNSQRQNIALDEDLVFQIDSSIEDMNPRNDFNPNRKKEVEKKSFPKKTISKNKMKDNRRQTIPLENDFILGSDDSVSTSFKYNPKNEKIALKENVSSRREVSYLNEKNEFDKQNLTEEEIIGDTINDFQCPKIPSGDDSNLHLHSSEEEQLNKYYPLGSSTSKNENKIQNCQRQNIALDEELVFQSNPSSEDINPNDSFNANEEKEVERKSVLKTTISEDKMKGNRRQAIALEDDFVLCSEGSLSTSCKYNPKNGKIALKDDFSSRRKVNYLNKENELVRQNLTEEEIIRDAVNNFQCQIPPSGDDSNFNLHSSEEEQLNRYYPLESSTSKNENKIQNGQRQNIALDEDLVFQSDPSSEDINPNDSFNSNEEKEVERKSVLKTTISEDGMKGNKRQTIALQDDFVLGSEGSLSTSCKYNPKNEKIALKDNFSCRREPNYLNKENELGTPVINYRSEDKDKTNNVLKLSNFKFEVDLLNLNEDSPLKTRKKEDMEHVYDDKIEDPDYQLNTLSDISSISDDIVGVETSNKNDEKVRVQEANRSCPGFSKDRLLATSQTDNSTNLKNNEDQNVLDENPNSTEKIEENMSSGLAALFAKLGLNDSTTAPESIITPSPPPKRASRDPNSYAMTQLRNIMRGTKPTNATRQVATQKLLQKEIERKQKEQKEKLYESKERGTRCLEKFRDDIFLKPRPASPRRHVSYSGFGATLQLPKNETKLQSRSASGIGYGIHIKKNAPAMENSMHNHIEYHVNRDPTPNVQHIPPTDEPYSQPSEDEDSYLNEIYSRECIGLKKSQNFCGNEQNNMRLKLSTNSDCDLKTDYDLRQQSFLKVNQQQSEPAYRTPDNRRPAALVPLNVGKSAPNLASKLASFHAALGFGPSDPWKPKTLPDIKPEGLSPKRSDSLLKQKPLPTPRLTTSIKPPALPGIGELPQMRRPFLGILSDRAL